MAKFVETHMAVSYTHLDVYKRQVTKIEKWCYHLKNAGKFKDCKGIILGQFTGITNSCLLYTSFLCEESFVFCLKVYSPFHRILELFS